MNELITTKEAAKILNVAHSTVRIWMGEPDRLLSNRNMYFRSRVEYIKTTKRIKKKKEHIKNVRKTHKNEDPYNQMINTTPTYRGRICNYPGCATPVPTHRYVCPEHRAWFENKREYYADE